MTIDGLLDLIWVIDMVALAAVGLCTLAWLLGCGLAVAAGWYEEWRAEGESLRDEWR